MVSKKLGDMNEEDGGKRGLGALEAAGYIFCALLLLLVLGFGAIFVYSRAAMSKTQKAADNALPELWRTADGSYELNWSALKDTGVDSYYVKVSAGALGGGKEEVTFFNGYVDGLSCRLSELPTDRGLIVQIDLLKRCSVLGKEYIWKQASIQRFFSIPNPVIKNLDWEIDSDAGTALISFDYQESNCCGIYVTEQGSRRLLQITEGNSVELDLNAEELWIPTPGNPCVLTLVPGKRVNGMTFFDGEPREVTITWEDFANRDIHLTMEVIDGCVCRLQWDELSCDYYEIQMKDGDAGKWETVKTTAKGDERTYISSRLHPGAGYAFRVVAMQGDYAAASEVLECRPEITPLYCTVWPVKDLKAYGTADKSEEAGKVKALEAYCVVEVLDDQFGIELDGRVCYIDSNYCMINLPEYVGALCSYDITNSYDSAFMAHGFEIPGLTGEVIKGFEGVCLWDGSFLVPLLYPTARKLEAAIENARKKGYRLKIYEAFRPHDASVYMYRKASEIQYATLPDSTYGGEEPGVVLFVRETDENGIGFERRKTYWELMNDSNDSFTLSAFVSAGVSRHNLGVALDLTLESLDSGSEMPMQTELHDLSQYSARARNNGYAKELSEIMMSAGYKDLYSEWWHFQDDEIKKKLSLPSVQKGVSAECFLTNGFVWRYRGRDGAMAVNCTLDIDGKEYTFDADGCVVEQAH